MPRVVRHVLLCKNPSCKGAVDFGIRMIDERIPSNPDALVGEFTCLECKQTARYTLGDLQEFPLAEGKNKVET